MPNNQITERMDELIRAVDEIFVGKIPSEYDLYGIHQVLVKRRDDELALQSVTDEEIEKTIEFYERHLWSRDDDLIEDDVSKRFVIVLSALHQMRSAPCEWVVDKWRDGWGNKRQCYVCPDCLKASAVKSKHCPNCGRKLVK